MWERLHVTVSVLHRGESIVRHVEMPSYYCHVVAVALPSVWAIVCYDHVDGMAAVVVVVVFDRMMPVD